MSLEKKAEFSYCSGSSFRLMVVAEKDGICSEISGRPGK